MRSRWTFILLLLGAGVWAETAPIQTFAVRECLGNSWSNEVVSFELSALPAGAAAPCRLLGPGGQAVPFQWASGSNGARSIAFQVDLPAFSSQEYRLEAGAASVPPATDLAIKQDPTCIRLTNALIGIEIPTAQGAYAQGPFQRLRLQSGTWIGTSRLDCKTAIESYAARVVAAGPVYAEVECLYRFAGGKQWQVNYRVEAHEPVVLVNESCSLNDGSLWQVVLNRDFSPTHFFASTLISGKDTAKYRFETLNYNGSVPLALAPWPVWWNPNSVAFFGLYRLPPGSAVLRGSQEMVALPGADEALEKVDLKPHSGADDGSGALAAIEQADGKPAAGVRPIDDFLGAAAGQAECWANPGDDGQSKYIPLCINREHELYLACYLMTPGRRWLLSALTAKGNLVASDAMSTAQQMMVKHLETPLNDVLHMVLEWNAKSAVEYPRLVARRSELAARPEVKESTTARRALMTDGTPGLRARQLLYPAMKIFLGSPDQPAQSVDTVHRCERIIRIATAADMLLGSDILTHRELSWALGFHAVEWGRPVLTEQDVFTDADIRYAQAQLAFLCYKLFSPNYYSLERNYRANPNMTTTRYCAMTILACLIPDHPLAKQWAQGGINEVDRELKEWTGPNGGWLESPHYQTTAMAGILLLSLAARDAGFANYLSDVRLGRAMRYLARISTPPDPRYENRRHFPPAGNTYQNETTGQFGVLAKVCRETNPELADELQWTWIQQGRCKESGIGGNFYAEALYANFEPARVPTWGSENFPGSGAVLRTGFPGPRETYLYLLQGGFAEHYDYDRGSFELWGKGRPLCLDWGYSFKSGRMAPYLHNRVDTGNWGEIRKFQTAEAADYLHSHQEGWDRQLLLVKDPDPVGANYFVLRDTIAHPAANWWLWFYTEQAIQLANDVLHVTGRHDVDVDLWLEPKLVKLLKSGTPKVIEKKEKKTVAMPDALGEGGKALGGEETETLNDIMKDPVVVKAGPPVIGVETRTITSECFDMSSQKQLPMTQEGLTLPITKDEPVFCVIYPRLRGEKSPTFAALAGGRGVKVTHSAGTDYVFMSAAPFEFHEGDISFKGRVGVIRARGATVDLTLSDGEEISKGEKQLRPVP